MVSQYDGKKFYTFFLEKFIQNKILSMNELYITNKNGKIQFTFLMQQDSLVTTFIYIRLEASLFDR